MAYTMSTTVASLLASLTIGLILVSQQGLAEVGTNDGLVVVQTPPTSTLAAVTTTWNQTSVRSSRMVKHKTKDNFFSYDNPPDYPFIPKAMVARCGLSGASAALPELNVSLAFVKTHKTGGSTVPGIINRICDGRNLEKMSPADNTYLGWPDKFPGNVRGMQYMNASRQYTAINNHVVMNRTAFEHYLKGPIYVFSIIRDPVAQAISSFNYFSMKGYTTWKSHIAYFKSLKQQSGWQLAVHLNSVAFDFGWYEQNDHSTQYDHDDARIDAFIAKIDKDLDYVMILEHITESLVLMTEFLPQLQVSELPFYSQKRTHVASDKDQDKSHLEPTAAEREELKDLWYVDGKIYQHFLKKLQDLWKTHTLADKSIIKKKMSLRCLNEFVAGAVDESSSEDRLPAHKLFRFDSGPYTSRLFDKQKQHWPEVGEGMRKQHLKKKQEDQLKKKWQARFDAQRAEREKNANGS